MRKLLASWSVFLAALCCSCQSDAVSIRPNVVIILTDDQGWGDIRSHGNDLVKTPVLDELAESGARFDRFFVSPVCAPTRASLLTGRYHLRSGVHGVTRGYETMRAEEITLAEVFKSAGYATGCFGKWHNGAHLPQHPNGQGFDEFIGFCGGHLNNYFGALLEHNGEPLRKDGYVTDVFTDAALDFMEANRERPFLCYLPFNAPHSPWQVPAKYYERLAAQGLTGELACAYAMVENLDDNIGRLLAGIETLGLTRHTIVVFLTDNGPNTDRYNGGMKGLKGSLHEGGVRVPFFLRWPGVVKPGLRIRHIAAHIDVLPTLAELCGIRFQSSRPLDGISLVPLLLEEAPDWSDRMIFNGWGGSSVNPLRGAVRTQRWRAVRYDHWELYDLTADPAQERNLAEEEPETLSELSQAYDVWFEDVTREGFAPIPITIGLPESSRVVLPGHEAFLHPEVGRGISYHRRAGYANDWIDSWRDLAAYPFWEIEVARPGSYEASLLYVCSARDVGSKVAVEVAGRRVEAAVEYVHDPEPLPSPDYVPRGEVYEKEWATLKVGRLELPEGPTRLRVKALSIPGEEALELKGVIVDGPL